MPENIDERMDRVQQHQYAIMEWLDDGNKLSIHHLKHVVDPVKSWNDYKTGDTGFALYPGTGDSRWKFKIHGVAASRKDLTDVLKNIIRERESGNLNASGQQDAHAPKRKRNMPQQPEKEKAKKTLKDMFESDEEENIDPSVLKSAYKSAVETVLSVRRRPQSQGKEVLTSSSSCQSRQALAVVQNYSEAGLTLPGSTLQGSYPPGQSTPRLETQNLNSGAGLTLPGSTLQGSYPPGQSTPRLETQNLNSGTGLTLPGSTLQGLYPPGQSTPRLETQNLNSGTGLTLPGSTLPGSYPPGQSTPRLETQSLNSGAGLTLPGSTLPGSYPPGQSTPRLETQNLNSGTGLTLPGSTLPGSYPPGQSTPRLETQNLNSGAGLTLPGAYCSGLSTHRLELQNFNSGAGLTVSEPSTACQTYDSDCNYVGTVGVTGSDSAYIDLDAPTSSLVQGAFSTLYNEEIEPSITPSCHSCCHTVKQLVNDLKQMKDEMERLKRKLKKNKSLGNNPDDAEETPVKYNGYSKHQLGEMVANLKSPTDTIKCLFKALFSVEELTTSSVTGKKTVKGECKDGLQESRRQCAEAIVKEKFPEMAIKDIRNKMRDRLKLFRRSHLPPPTDKIN